MEHVSQAAPDQAPPPEVMFTAAELDAHRRELDRLRAIRDRELPQLLRDARGFVASDAAEEIVQIHEDLAVIAKRISGLEDALRSARVVTEADDHDAISVGSVAEVEYLGSGRVVTYRVTGSALSAGPGTISAGSPVGRALIGRAAGDVVAVDLPAGHVQHLRVLAVGAGALSSW